MITRSGIYRSPRKELHKDQDFLRKYAVPVDEVENRSTGESRKPYLADLFGQGEERVVQENSCVREKP